VFGAEGDLSPITLINAAAFALFSAVSAASFGTVPVGPFRGDAVVVPAQLDSVIVRPDDAGL
jgi:hypothetical protein